MCSEVFTVSKEEHIVCGSNEASTLKYDDMKHSDRKTIDCI